MPSLRKPLAVAFVLTATALLTSCSQTGTAAPSPTSPSTTSTGLPAASAIRRIDITVMGKQVTPQPATVNIAAGESLTIAVTSDRDNTLHAHGFEIAKDIKAGQRSEVTIKGAQSGVFEFELHDPELRLLQVAVR